MVVGLKSSLPPLHLAEFSIVRVIFDQLLPVERFAASCERIHQDRDNLVLAYSNKRKIDLGSFFVAEGGKERPDLSQFFSMLLIVIFFASQQLGNNLGVDSLIKYFDVSRPFPFIYRYRPSVHFTPFYLSLHLRIISTDSGEFSITHS